MAIKGQLDLEIGKFNAGLARAEANVRKSTSRMRKDSAKGGEGFGGGVTEAASKGLGLKGFTGPLLAATAGYKAARFAADSFTAAMERESMVAGLAAVSAEEVNGQLERLRDLARQPGLGMNQVITASTNLQAVGMSAAGAEALIQEMGNALALVGKGKADMDGVTLALTQIASKGKISAQEINQMAERLPQIRTLMQTAFGTADTEVLNKMGISAEEFFAKITEAAKELPRAAITTQEQLNNMADDFNELKVAAGEALVPLANELLPRLATMFRDVAQSVNSYAKNLEAIGGNKFAKEQAEVTVELAKQLQIMKQRPGYAAAAAKAEKDKAAAEKAEAAAASANKPKPVADEKEKAEAEKAAKEEASLREKFASREIAGLVKGGDISGLRGKLDELLAETVGIFPDFDKSVAGLGDLAQARLQGGNIKGADEALGWLEDAEKLQAALVTSSETTAKSLESLRADAVSGAFDLLDPKQQAAQVRDQLGASLGIDIKGAADVERGLAGLRAEAEELRALGDTEGEKAALERLSEAQSSAKELAGMGKTDEEGSRTRAASGGVANAIAQIFGRASQDDVLLDATRSQVTAMKSLNKILTDFKRDGVKIDTDTFSF